MSRGARGSVIPYVALGLAALAVLTLLLSVVGGSLVAKRRTEAAADLAALAAATAIQHGRHPCAAADRSARLNDARVMVCEVDGETVTVEVSRQAPRMLGRDFVVRAQARAGPR